MHDSKIVIVGPDNLEECGIGCIKNREHPGYMHKTDWLQRRFAEGLRILLYREEKTRPLAFMEYVPGEFAWRRVDAEGWLFVHCLWVISADQRHAGLGTRLIKACVQEAEKQGKMGVAAMVSNGKWLAGERVFLNNGFTKIEERDRFGLVTYPLRKGAEPQFRNVDQNASIFRGLHIVYSNQCPMLSKSASDVSEMAAEHGLKVKVTVLKSACEAQNSPSYYGTYGLLWNGRLLSDHYVSRGRFKNILKNEILNPA